MSTPIDPTSSPTTLTCTVRLKMAHWTCPNWLWMRLGRTEWLKPPSRPSFEGHGKAAAFWGSVRHDIVHAGGFLVLGAMAAATLKAVVPDEWLSAVADNPVIAIIALAILAVLLSICSEADAFVAASLSRRALHTALPPYVVWIGESWRDGVSAVAFKRTLQSPDLPYGVARKR